MTVVMKDSTNRSSITTTNFAGGFSFNTTGMTPPYILQLTLPTGASLYSVSADADSQTTINLTPVTDLILRSWYATQGVAAETAFANSVNAAPTPQQVGSISQIMFSLLGLGIATHAADLTRPEQLISKPFAADGTGTDKLLDNLRITASTNGGTLTVTAGGTSQVSVVSYNTTTTAISASTTAVNGTATSTSVITSVVPVNTAQTVAVNDINAAVARLENVINTRKTSLTAADILPLVDPDLLHEGKDRTRFAAEIANGFQRGQTVSLTVEQVMRLDVSAGLAAVVVRITETLGTVTSTEKQSIFLRKVAGAWLMSGDGRIARVEVRAEARRDQGANRRPEGPVINTGVEAVEGLVSSVTVVGPFGSLVSGTSTTSIDAGVRFTSFFAITDVLTAPLPAAGTPIVVTLSKTAGGAAGYTLPLNAFTTELIRITSPTGLTLASAKPGTTVNVSWTLPTTYAVERIKLAAHTFTGPLNLSSTLRCITDEAVLANTATSGTLAIPATCAGLPVLAVNINLSTNGRNGERSIVIYSF